MWYSIFGWSFQNQFRVKYDTHKLNCIVFADELPVPHIRQRRSTSVSQHFPQHPTGQYNFLPSWIDVYEDDRKIGGGTLRDSFTVLTNAAFIRNVNSHFVVSYREPYTERFFYRNVSRVYVRPVAHSTSEHLIAELHLSEPIPRQRVLNPYYVPEFTKNWIFIEITFVHLH